jgi:hypothetical protein
MGVIGRSRTIADDADGAVTLPLTVRTAAAV